MMWMEGRHKELLVREKSSSSSSTTSISTSTLNAASKHPSHSHSPNQESEKMVIIVNKKYDSQLLSICAKCRHYLLPQLRTLRKEFKKSELINRLGCVSAGVFREILLKFNVLLPEKEFETLIKS